MEDFMNQAIVLANSGSAAGDYKLGSVVVDPNGDVVGEAHTSLKTSIDPTAHAEILAIRRASEKMDSRLLEGCYLYSTLEPCPMCTSAAIWAKMGGLVFGATLEDALTRGGEWKNGIFYSWRQIKIKSAFVAERGDPKIEVFEGFMRDKCVELLPGGGS
ncbi:nucleoside deaminase [Actinoplanes sp. NPDC048988]|uniref:nucleoside deaminase n=1 Tax=Actinoplanes sp. NPDC048988 TaxID=3363901 RepID=UPI0037130A58